MTEFDELLKAKAEQAEYPYRASAWRQFCRRAGIRALTGGQIAAIAVSGTAVAGLVVWGVASHIGRQPAAEPAPVEVAVVAPDTAAILPDDTFVVEEIQPAAVPAKPAPVVQREMPAAKPEEVKTSVFWDMGIRLAYDIHLYKHYCLEVSGGVKNVLDMYQRDLDKGENRDADYIYGPTQPRTYFVGLRLKL